MNIQREFLVYNENARNIILENTALLCLFNEAEEVNAHNMIEFVNYVEKQNQHSVTPYIVTHDCINIFKGYEKSCSMSINDPVTPSFMGYEILERYHYNNILSGYCMMIIPEYFDIKLICTKDHISKTESCGVCYHRHNTKQPLFKWKII